MDTPDLEVRKEQAYARLLAGDEEWMDAFDGYFVEDKLKAITQVIAKFTREKWGTEGPFNTKPG